MASGLNIPKAQPRYRLRRFLAFLIDLAVVILLWFISYQIIGKPDFASVKTAMDAAKLLPPEGQTEAYNAVFTNYNVAFQFGLIIWFAYDALTTLVLGGRTVGKLIMGLRIVPMNPERGRLLNLALLLVRSLFKVLSLYLFQAFPFIICALTVFTSSNRSGFDFFVKTKVIRKGEE